MIAMGIGHYFIYSMSLLEFVAMTLNKHPCMPVTCFNCNSSIANHCLNLCETGANSSCIVGEKNGENTCKKDFQVWLKPSATEITEGDPFTVSCEHNLTLDHIENFIWHKDEEHLPDQNTSQLTLHDEFTKFTVSCKIQSFCGLFSSDTEKIDVKGNSVLILVACAGTAVALLLIFTFGMKLLLRRDIAQRKTRKRQQEQNTRTNDTTANQSSANR